MAARHLLCLALFAGSLACHASSGASEIETSGAPAGADPTVHEPVEVPAKPRDRSITIGRGDVHEPHEVELDPRGEVALTIDAHGGMRLWPAIRSGDPQQSSPYELPMVEPLWMSLAQAEGGFVVATIDTTNAGQVVAVTPSADGREAKLTPLFSTPPGDPLLELHALDGGQRFLALGVDHRVRLYDRSGTLISVIDQRSFAPWQLRVVHGEPGQPPMIAAMLAQPLRVQAIELREHQLSIKGEARTVVLDRGPNRNDLALSPDGKTVAALRRRSGRSLEFSIELIDLETDARRLVAGKSDSTIRPRMHFVDAERLLLETGSSKGTGMWIELAKAEALSNPADADPEGPVAKRLSKTQHATIPLAGSAEHKPEFFDPEFDPSWDHGERLYASVVGGLRVGIERNWANMLIVDPLDTDRHFAISGGVVGYHALALDQTGAYAAMGVSAKQLRVARLDGSSEPAEIEHDIESISLLAFVDDRRVVMVGDKDKLRLIDWQAGQVVVSSKLAQTWGIAAVAFHAQATGGGVLGYRSSKPSDPVRLIPIENGQLGAVVELARDQRTQWLDILELGDAEAGALFGMSEDQADDRIDEHTSDRSGRLFFTEKHPRTPLFVREGSDQRTIALPAGQARELSLSPDGSKIAIVQFRERDDSNTQDHLISVFDLATGDRLWTLGTPGKLAMPSWSGDGKHIVVGQTIGDIRDAATGEPIHPDRGSVFSIEDRSDADWAKQTGFRDNR
jgi:WD40 repeat protein